MPNRKVRVAALSIGSNSALITLKVIAGLLSNSVSIISEAIHSGMDLLASVVAFFSVLRSGMPADEAHPYGHGKFENVSGIIEGLLIFVAAGLIIWHSIRKMLSPSELGETTLAIAVMAFAAIINAFVSALLYRVARQEDSIALEADALHLKTDVYTSLGVAVGLTLIKITGWYILDPIVAILVALMIVRESWLLCREAFRPLLDGSLPPDEAARIEEILRRYEGRILNYHDLRTRKSGSFRFVDLHLTVDGGITVAEAHALGTEIELEIEQELKNIDVTIHVDPEGVVD